MLIKRNEKLFARKDYEGLTRSQAKALKAERSQYAKSLKSAYRNAQDSMKGSIIDHSIANGGSINKTVFTNSINPVGTYNFTSSNTPKFIEFDNRKNTVKTPAAAIKKSNKDLAEGMLNASKKDAAEMRSRVAANQSVFNDKSALKRIKRFENQLEGQQVAKKGISKNAKIAAGVATGATALGLGALAYKHYKNKKKTPIPNKN